MTRTATIQFPDHAGITIEYPASDLMDNVAREIFSGAEYPAIPFLNTANTTILDIGANVGCAAILFALQNPHATIYALEPARQSYEFLAKNTAPFPNIKTFPIGAYNADQTADLYPGRAASVTSSLFPGGQSATTPSEKITLRRLSTFLQEHSITRISILKLDTEGAELPILNDIAHLLPAIDAIHLEFHSESDRLALDRLLAPHFSLCHGRIITRHRGLLLYLAKPLLASQPEIDADEIHRP